MASAQSEQKIAAVRTTDADGKENLEAEFQELITRYRTMETLQRVYGKQYKQPLQERMRDIEQFVGKHPGFANRALLLIKKIL